MNLGRFFCEHSQLWPSFTKKATDILEVSTVTFMEATESPQVNHEAILPSKLGGWLTDHPSSASITLPGLSSLKMVWVLRDVIEKTDHISEIDLRTVIENMGLGVAQQHHSTAMSGIGRFSSCDGGRSIQFCFRMHPKLIVLWSYDYDHQRVSGICFAALRQLSRIKNILEMHWRDPILVLPLACAAVLSAEIDETQESAKQDIRATEARTGYHKWSSRTELPATDDLGILLAKMSGLAAKMAAVARKHRIIEHVMNFITTQTDPAKGEDRFRIPHEAYANDISYLRQRTDIQKVDTVFIRCRIEIQISALHGLIAQYDAVASQKTANDAKVVAVASQKDSNSMKTLAVVTMLYLPGQVVASIFAMPLFDWSAGQKTQNSSPSTIVNSRFAIYWAVTVPLTVATFALAALWLFFEKRHRRKEGQAQYNESTAMGSGILVPEIKTLARHRSTTTPTKASEGPKH